jgi:hypothetical protein
MNLHEAERGVDVLESSFPVTTKIASPFLQFRLDLLEKRYIAGSMWVNHFSCFWGAMAHTAAAKARWCFKELQVDDADAIAFGQQAIRVEVRDFPLGPYFGELIAKGGELVPGGGQSARLGDMRVNFTGGEDPSGRQRHEAHQDLHESQLARVIKFESGDSPPLLGWGRLAETPQLAPTEQTHFFPGPGHCVSAVKKLPQNRLVTKSAYLSFFQAPETFFSAHSSMLCSGVTLSFRPPNLVKRSWALEGSCFANSLLTYCAKIEIR